MRHQDLLSWCSSDHCERSPLILCAKCFLFKILCAEETVSMKLLTVCWRITFRDLSRARCMNTGEARWVGQWFPYLTLISKPKISIWWISIKSWTDIHSLQIRMPPDIKWSPVLLTNDTITIINFPFWWVHEHQSTRLIGSYACRCSWQHLAQINTASN